MIKKIQDEETSEEENPSQYMAKQRLNVFR